MRAIISRRGVTWRFTFSPLTDVRVYACADTLLRALLPSDSHILLEPSACVPPVHAAPAFSATLCGRIAQSTTQWRLPITLPYRGTLNAPRYRLPFVSDLSQIPGRARARVHETFPASSRAIPIGPRFRPTAEIRNPERVLGAPNHSSREHF